jgi:phosphoglycerate dehydrogenase-like enzyme
VTAPPLIVSVPDERLRASLGPQPEGVEIIEWDMASPAPLVEIDMVVTPYVGAVKRIRALNGVRTRLVQSQSLGFDGITELLPVGTVYANATSVHETSTAELTLALVLASQRGIPDFVRAAQLSHWAPAWHPSLADRTVLLIGYGGVGQAIERRLDPFEVDLVRVANSARIDGRGPIHCVDSLPELLPLADIVIVIVPLTAATTHLVDDRFLEAMKDGALLVNVSRGPVADTSALLAHAQRGRLRFALDVTDPEPLPDGHPLFALPNVLITPHVAGASSAMVPRIARLVNEQIARLVKGDDPLNVVFRS